MLKFDLKQLHFSKSFRRSKALAAGKLCARIVPSLVRVGTQLNIPGLLAALVPVNATMGEGAFGFYGPGIFDVFTRLNA